MDIESILQQIDTYFAENKGEEAERLMLRSIEEAVRQQENEVLLPLLNELLGYYRETSQVENSFQVAEQALALAQQMGLEGSIPYATTLLNVANAYRAGGRLEDSLQCYQKVRQVYDKGLSQDNMLVASLENNLSLLHQEMGDFQQAKDCLKRALEIVRAKAADFEIAVTYANLASTCMQLGEHEEAHYYAGLAIADFEKMGVQDAHYGAALSAMGTYYYREKSYEKARSFFEKAARIMEANLGKNEYFYRLQENAAECDRELEKRNPQEPLKKHQLREASGIQMQKAELSELSEEGIQVQKARFAERNSGNAREQEKMQEDIKGLELCREYYEAYGKPMLEQQFPDYVDKVAVGLVGEGSDCFGYDDALSRDHDWGPDFCMWVTERTYAEIGEALQRAYDQLPKEFKGHTRTVSPQGRGRRGVMTIPAFYRRLLQAGTWEELDWQQVSDAALAAAVNGEVFRDAEGVFTAFRRKLQEGYPERIRYLKLAESAARFSQSGQYNYPRMLQRGDGITVQLMLGDALREAMKLKYYIEGKYPPHDKWLYTGLKELPGGEVLCGLLQQLRDGSESVENRRSAATENGNIGLIMEQLGAHLASELYQKHFISDIESYLDAHTEELLTKAALTVHSNEELVDKIAQLEFEAFDKVQNVGGRASCQNDWATFSIMRKSQYLTWNRIMLLQYYYDFQREYLRGHNLIEEKYGRMMESTAPEEYAQIKDYFPVLSSEKQAIIESIVAMQVNWMEDFAKEYPSLADNARSVRSTEDHLYNTSYETYLRGEISTYSDKMLELYGRYVVEHAGAGQNLAYEIMTNNVHLYGYESLEAAERFLRL